MSETDQKQGMSMDKELQKLAIVAVCKWDRRQEGAQVWYERDGVFVAHHALMLDDLNALARARGHGLNMGDGKGSVYRYPKELKKIVNRDRHSAYQDVTMATAEQQREAFLRCHELWTPTGEENE